MASLSYPNGKVVGVGLRSKVLNALLVAARAWPLHSILLLKKSYNRELETTQFINCRLSCELQWRGPVFAVATQIETGDYTDPTYNYL